MRKSIRARWQVRQVGAEFGTPEPFWYAQDTHLGYCTEPTTRAGAIAEAMRRNYRSTD